MNAWVEITKALVGLIQQGGELAIWGLTVYLLFTIFRVAIICWVIYSVVRLVSQAVQSQLTLKLLARKDSIQLLSQKCSKYITDAIKDYQQTTTTAMKKFMEQAESLLGKSKSETEKTA